MQSKWLVLLVLGLISLSAFALDVAEVYNQASLFGKQYNTSAIISAKQTSPNAVPGFQTDTPQQANYQTSSLQGLANTEASHNPQSQFIEKSFIERSQVVINKNDSLIQKANDLNKNADQTLQDSNAFCKEGNCADTTYSPSPDFNTAIANLSAGAAASKDFDGQHIFSGAKQECRKAGIGFSDCCKNTGWGQDVNLASCTANEKTVAMTKLAGGCHYVGKYCSHQVLGACRLWKQSYCCFDSKLARIVQEQGRGQLNIVWASPKHPDCRGFTADELQHVNFSIIDFTEYYQDIKNQEQLPNTNETQQQIANKVQSFYQQAQ